MMWSQRRVATLMAAAIFVRLSGILYDEGELFNNAWMTTQTARRTISNRSRQPERILLITYVFSEEAANKRYLRLFLESAATAGVDLLVVGDNGRYARPTSSNVQQYDITWDDFVTRVETKLDIDASALRTALSLYKIIDFKPLFAFLFPELVPVQKYDWWGHVDNDMLLGDIRAGVAPYLGSADIISGIVDHPTWGPFTLYRNTERINTLFRSATASPQQLFGTAEPVCFDEWGQCGPFKRHKGASMSGIIERMVSSQSSSSSSSSSSTTMIRVQQGVPHEVVWDGHCKFKTFGRPKHRCSECAYRRQGSMPLMSRNTDGTYQPAFLCHYEYAKHRIEDKLVSSGPSTMENMLAEGEFRVNFLDGFQPIPDEDKAKMAALETTTANTILKENLRSKATTAAPSSEPVVTTTTSGHNVISSASLPPPPLLPPALEGQPPAKLLIVSYIFSAAAVNKRYVRFFAETASTSGADILLLGDVRPSFPLPARVRHYLMSWPDLVNLSSSKLHLATTANETMQNATRYKVNDYKPLFAHLFPDLVAGYDWWGHIDNDLLLGNVTAVLARYGPTSDIISGSPDHSTWGPFTLFRNTPDINTLFQRATISLDQIFANPKPVCFDEWGSCGYRRWPGAAMASIVDLNAAALDLRVQRGVGVEAVWDGFCHHPRYGYSKQVSVVCHVAIVMLLVPQVYHDYLTFFALLFSPRGHKKHCAECTYRRGSDHPLQILHADGASVEALLCHYQYAKRRLEESLADEHKVQSLLDAGVFQVNYLDGFQPV
jgi:hypothetical protein